MTPTEVVAAQVRQLRRKRDWTAAELAAKMTEVGIPWDRSLVSRLETGTRENITLVEVLALAAVLNVAPIHLFVPVDSRIEYEVTPNWTIDVPAVRRWVRGQAPLPGADGERFFAEEPREETAQRLMEELLKATDEVTAHAHQRGGDDAA
jgi:transcriptional regulator with XRE-family HTH domain